jgi:hypothetical protein
LIFLSVIGLSVTEDIMRLHLFAAALTTALFTSFSTFAAEPCCSEQDFQGVGQSPEGVKIQLVEVARTSPEDIRVTWTLKNTTQKPQVLTLGNGGAWRDAYKLSWDAHLLDSAGRLKMNVAKDTKGNVVAAKHAPDLRSKGIVLGPGKTLTTWAKFIAPEKTTKVSVDLPGASMPWENVAVTPAN